MILNTWWKVKNILLPVLLNFGVNDGVKWRTINLENRECFETFLSKFPSNPANCRSEKRRVAGLRVAAVMIHDEVWGRDTWWQPSSLPCLIACRSWGWLLLCFAAEESLQQSPVSPQPDLTWDGGIIQYWFCSQPGNNRNNIQTWWCSMMMMTGQPKVKTL